MNNLEEQARSKLEDNNQDRGVSELADRIRGEIAAIMVNMLHRCNAVVRTRRSMVQASTNDMFSDDDDDDEGLITNEEISPNKAIV